MFDIGWTEMLVVAVVAILFVGPKELPGMLRTFGKTIRKVRGLAGDFQKQFDDALKESELDGLKQSVNDLRSLDPRRAIKDSLNPLKDDLERTADQIKKGSEKTEGPLVFDETKAPTPPEPVRVDVEAALKRQKELDAETRKLASEKSASEKRKSPTKPASKSSPSAKASAQKTASAKPKTTSAKSTAAPKKTAARNSAPAKPASPRKTAAARKPAAKSSAARAKPTAKTPS